jgi:hypothetical protein
MEVTVPHITFVHGLANKPPEDHLHSLWVRKLGEGGGIDLDTNAVTSEMVYWADILYESPDTNLGSYESAGGGAETLQEAASGTGLDPMRLAVEDSVRIERLAGALGLDPANLTAPAPSASELDDVKYERIPLPAWLRTRMMGILLRDAHHYFLNVPFRPRAGGPEYRVRDEIRRRFLEKTGAVTDSQRPHVLVTHSMGTVIAYDCLMHEPECPPVDHLVTIGSPLGLDEVQDFFSQWDRDNGFPSGKVRGRWLNVFDHLDPVVGFDPYFANDFRKGGSPAVEDVCEPNWGTWRHNISKYLQGKEFRSRLGSMLGVTWP